MDQQNYHSDITVNTDISTAFKSIQTRVSEWWTPDLEGRSANEGDEFTVHFGDTFVTFKVTGIHPDQKISWLVINSYLPGLKDKTEWDGTSMLWEFEADGQATKINFTHLGLIPEIECYDNCTKGWNFFFKESLYKLLTTGKGMPNQRKSER